MNPGDFDLVTAFLGNTIKEQTKKKKLDFIKI